MWSISHLEINIMIWFFAINFGLLVFLDIEPAYKLLWFVALWLSTVIKVSKDMKDVWK